MWSERLCTWTMRSAASQSTRWAAYLGSLSGLGACCCEPRGCCRCLRWRAGGEFLREPASALQQPTVLH